MMRLFLAFAIFFCVARAHAQTDTLKIAQYNLLNYGNSANPVAFKNPRLATIVGYVQPDVLGVNEMFSPVGMADSVLKVLGTGWAKTAHSNAGGQTQVNSLFYKTDKLQLRGQTVVSSVLRDIIAYRLQYKDTITHPHDTVGVTVIVCHLKASSSSSDEADRAAETATIAAFINAQGNGSNTIVMGDMNVYSDAEQGYQNLVGTGNSAAKLKDPIGRPGTWHADASYAGIHTQSPRTMALGDGSVTGGLDDRFDQLLVSASIMGEGAGVKYLPGSYQAIGQDGQHYNKALTDTPTNTAAPASVIQALYEMSDHLPIAAHFILHTAPLPGTGIAAVPVALDGLRAVNPISDRLTLFVPHISDGKTLTLRLYNLQGMSVYVGTSEVSGGKAEAVLKAPLSLGVYLLTVTDSRGQIIYQKLQVI